MASGQIRMSPDTMRQIREYEEVFEDKLEDDAKIQLLGYQMKNGK